MDRDERKKRGAWYTPHELVDQIVRRAVAEAGWGRGCVVDVLDPACGDGRFLAAAAEAVAASGATPRLMGVDIDPAAAAVARSALGAWDAEVRVADALASDWDADRFDLVLGNPPFLSQMAAGTTRGRSSQWGGGPYADAAVEFLALAGRVTRSNGRIGLVLPQSVMGSRDAAVVRQRVGSRSAARWFWWSASSVFEAQVRTCAVVLEIDGSVSDHDAVAISQGLDFVDRPPVRADGWRDGEWSSLLATALGTPTLPPTMSTAGTLSDHATTRLDFRDHFYGVAAAMIDGGGDDAPPLVTSGLIDPLRLLWGSRSARIAKARYAEPRVVLDRLAPEMRRWAESRLVPKVLVASQTRMIEAAVDTEGTWLPGVPVVTVMPRAGGAGLWSVAAVLTSPVATAWVAVLAAGTALSSHALRVTPAALGSVPWPAGDLAEAETAARAGDVVECGAAVCRAYGLSDDEAAPLLSWWLRSAPGSVR